MAFGALEDVTCSSSTMRLIVGHFWGRVGAIAWKESQVFPAKCSEVEGDVKDTGLRT